MATTLEAFMDWTEDYSPADLSQREWHTLANDSARGVEFFLVAAANTTILGNGTEQIKYN
jgi:hypothetical protein